MRRKRRGRTLRRFLVAGFTILVLAGLLGGIAAFNLSPAQLENRVTIALRGALAPGCAFSLGQVRYRVGEGLIIEDFRLSCPPESGASDFLAVRRIRAVPKLRSLLGGAAAFSLVEIDGCDVRLECDPEKIWNFMGILRPAAAPDAGASPDRVLFTNATVHIARASLAALLELEDGEIPEDWCCARVEGRIDAQRDRMAVAAAVTHALLPALRIEGVRMHAERRGSLSLAAYKAPISAETLRLLPAPLRRAVAPYDPAGAADLRIECVFEPDAPPALHLEGRIFGGQASLPGLPYLVRHIKGVIAFDGETLSFPEGIEGAIAEGAVTASGSLALRGDAPGKLTVNVDRIALDERLAETLPEDVRALWKRLNVRGEAGGEAELRWSNGVLDPKVVIRLGGVSVAYDELPYSVGDVRGTLVYERGHLRTESPLSGVHGATAVTASIDAEAKERGRIDVMVRARGVRLDQYLRSCLSPAAREAWDQFRPEGTADAEIAIARASGEEDTRLTVTLTATDARMCYIHFPYTIEGITGKLIINHNDIEALDLAGVHGAAQIKCGKGFWRVKDGREQYAFVFESPNMPVDHDLAQALPEEQRRTLEEFGFQGSVAAKATVLRLPEHEQMHLEIEADLLRGRMEYARFPYPLRLGGGHISIAPSIIRIENLTTDEPELFVRLERGTIEDAGDERRYDFRLEVKNLRPEPAFVRALPPHAGRLLSELAVEGVFAAPRITVGYAHARKNPDDFTLRYFVEDLAAEDAAMNLGMRFRHMQGRASILGSAAAGVPHAATGKIELSRLSFNRLWLTDVVLKCTYGAPHELIRALAAAGAAVPDAPPLEDDERRAFIARLEDEAQTRDCFQVWIARAAAYEGAVKGFLAVDVGARKDITGAVDVQGLNLSAASEDIFRRGEAEGIASVHAFFRGTIPDVATFTGQGRGQIKEANLVKLPLFISMFRDVLSVQRIKETYFHLVDARFRIEHGKFTAPGGDSIAMESDVMTLRGFGSVDFGLNCDLFLSLPSFGLPQIPLVSPFLRRIIDNIAAFHVTGPLDDPQISYVLMRDIQMLFRGEQK